MSDKLVICNDTIVGEVQCWGESNTIHVWKDIVNDCIICYSNVVNNTQKIFFIKFNVK